MEFEHKPVLLDECIENLDIKKDGIYVDGTIGGAGHACEILKRLGHKGLLIGIDQDKNALQVSKQRLEKIKGGKFHLAHGNFSDIDKLCFEFGITKVDGILLDIGVSSYQLDTGERGFSYNKDAPLDMRMNTEIELTAKKVVNTYTEENLVKLIRDYGEERWAVRVVKFIIERREIQPIETTFQLVEVIKAAIPKGARKDGPHPARRTFQALRIEVNKELDVLSEAVEKGVELLNKDGRFCIISFHSLEDRIVKESYKTLAKGCICPPGLPVCVCGKEKSVKIITRKPIIASQEELEGNARARSAKLRVVKKI